MSGIQHDTLEELRKINLAVQRAANIIEVTCLLVIDKWAYTDMAKDVAIVAETHTKGFAKLKEYLDET